jgi:iron complex transport system substrate-binding protein
VPHRSFAVVALVAALFVGACGSNGDSAAENQPGTTAPAVAFPVTVEAANGGVRITERPEKIVSLSPTATETLFSIGAGDQVAAVDDQSNYPADAPRTKLSGFQPNVEAIAGFEPDLVIAAFDPGGLVRGLGKLEIPVLLLPAAKDLEDAYTQMQALGQATGHNEEADALVTRMRSRISELTDEVPAESRLTVYHELGPDFFSATSKTFIGSVYELLGLENIADEAGGAAPDYPQLSAEYILTADPDLIVLSDTKCCGQTLETVAARPGWKTLTAVKQRNVVLADDDVASRWGPRTVDFAELITRAIADLQAS